jgi:hypothetical protein
MIGETGFEEEIPAEWMSASGQTATFARRRGMSVPPPGADMPVNGSFCQQRPLKDCMSFQSPTN